MEDSISPPYGSWEPVSEAFLEWLGGREKILQPGLSPEPTIKVLTFLALLESDKACTYDEIREIFKKKSVIRGNLSDNTLRTSVLNLGKTLEKFGHALELRSLRGRFQLIGRSRKSEWEALEITSRNVLLLDDPTINETEIAKIFIEKSMMSFNALYFLEWSARTWEIYSRDEAKIRVPYESGALDELGIQQRLFKSHHTHLPLSVIGLGPSEGLAEIALLKKLLSYDGTKKIHYLAIDSSPRLLRNHIGLLKESLTEEIANGRLLCAGVNADIFSNLDDTIRKVRNEFKIIQSDIDFIPPSSGVLVTYFGNCLGNDGNNAQDPEVGFFSMIRSMLPNRPLEILVGVSVMRSQPDEYQRSWDDFLLQTPRHFLETRKLFESSREENSNELPEFTLSNSKEDSARCPAVIPEPYSVRHQIEGQIYRFYYKLAFDLKLNECSSQESRQLPKGTLILLYNIIKYNMRALVSGIEKIGLFKVKYNPDYHQLVSTENGAREYAVFSAYIEE